MTALDYKIGFGFKGQDGTYYGPKGSVGLYHLGNDYYAPLNTPLVLQGVQLGLSGNTGIVAGPHVHVAKWKPGNVIGGYFVSKYNRTYFDPGDVTGQTGKVSEVGKSSDAGNFVRISANNGFTYEFFHLNRQDVKVGDIIGGGEKQVAYIAPETVRSLFQEAGLPPPTAEQENYYSHHPGGYTELYKDFWKVLAATVASLKAQLAQQPDKAATDKLNKIKEIIG